MPRYALALTLIGGILPILAGCADMGTQSYADTPEYRQGHSAGCWAATSGKKDAANRNEALYKSSDAYRAGWKAGFNSCRVDSGARDANDPNTGRSTTSPFGY
ncbi:hypothetical protein [Parvibaculum sp. MBR-TMA-1.3b-4.2]|jgi:hypothetical protein